MEYSTPDAFQTQTPSEDILLFLRTFARVYVAGRKRQAQQTLPSTVRRGAMGDYTGGIRSQD